jgi:hypothetical protein
MKRGHLADRPSDRRSVVTASDVPASPGETWNALMLFEEIGDRPPVLLRLLLPRPLRTEGRWSAAGDVARCLYEEGHLLKRMTRVERGRYCAFEVIEQRLTIASGIRLEGGSYTLSPVPEGSTRIELQTRYFSPLRPAWFWRFVETALCHVFHRHILRAIRMRAQATNAFHHHSGRDEPTRREQHTAGA